MRGLNVQLRLRLLLFILATALPPSLLAQSVCLPAPRLLTTLPMGGQTGTTFDVTITGDNLDEDPKLLFSHPGITAKPTGTANKYSVTVTKDVPTGIHEARMMTRLGISSSRAFTIGAKSEVVQTKGNQSVEKAMELKLNSICNAVMTTRAVDHYSFTAKKDQRVVVECVTKGIDSRMNGVLIVADENGRDLKVDRLGGLIDFTAPSDGKFVIKVHDLTYKGGNHYFYRLAVSGVAKGAPTPRHPIAANVNSFSWRDEFLPETKELAETEPNNKHEQAQKVTLPLNVTGRFYPAADVDTFEFEAKKGEEWWIEVVSERIGLPTDPFVLVQHVDKGGKLTDVAEMNDIKPPMKPSSNGYSYDGPPYNAGSADVLAKLTIKTDGLHRLQVRDLFGGTRSIKRHTYRLIVRKAQPDFTLVAWAMHMNLRNGDRNALSKPIALRNGRTMAFEVATIRRDGFEGQINIDMEGLPDGMSAQGFYIPKKRNYGHLVITADDRAPRTLGSGTIFATAQINGKTVRRPIELASMKWPVTNARNDIPAPRLFPDVPVSVGGGEAAPLTLRPEKGDFYEGVEKSKITVPVKVVTRGIFSGANISFKAYGPGFERCKFEVPLKEGSHDVVFDLADLKLPAGEYVCALYGRAVSKYKYNEAALILAEATKNKAEADAKKMAAKAKQLADAAKAAPAEKKAAADEAAKKAAAEQKTLEKTAATAAIQLKSAESRSRPKDIVDIIISEPIRIRVLPEQKK
ncbi:MAG: serine protease [Verrucomicrobiales bacterium]|nr:serine protease [Verrucomicrobiales bacterium]